LALARHWLNLVSVVPFRNLFINHFVVRDKLISLPSIVARCHFSPCVAGSACANDPHVKLLANNRFNPSRLSLFVHRESLSFSMLSGGTG